MLGLEGGPYRNAVVFSVISTELYMLTWRVWGKLCSASCCVRTCWRRGRGTSFSLTFAESATQSTPQGSGFDLHRIGACCVNLAGGGQATLRELSCADSLEELQHLLAPSVRLGTPLGVQPIPCLTLCGIEAWRTCPAQPIPFLTLVQGQRGSARPSVCGLDFLLASLFSHNHEHSSAATLCNLVAL